MNFKIHSKFRLKATKLHGTGAMLDKPELADSLGTHCDARTADRSESQVFSLSVLKIQLVRMFFTNFPPFFLICVFFAFLIALKTFEVLELKEMISSNLYAAFFICFLCGVKVHRAFNHFTFDRKNIEKKAAARTGVDRAPAPAQSIKIKCVFSSQRSFCLRVFMDLLLRLFETA